MKKSTVRIVVILILVIIGALLAFLPKKSQKSQDTTTGDNTGKTVTVDYVGKFQDGEVFDTSSLEVARANGLDQKAEFQTRQRTGLTFVVGAGQMIAGFDNAVKDMKVGEKKTITLSPKDAYGERDESKITTISKSLFEDAGLVPEIGTTVGYMGGPATVTALTETGVTIDYNSPMAGKTLVFDITLLSIQ